MSQRAGGTTASATTFTLRKIGALVSDRALLPLRHPRKICILLGAGADISSGGMTFSRFKRDVLTDLAGEPVFESTAPHDVDRRFGALVQRTKPEERALLVERVFRRMQPLAPSDAYKLLVLLADEGGLDAVVTTNFDIMLERAQELVGRNVFQIYAPGLARPYMVVPDGLPLPKKPYVKLHGDLSARTVTVLTSDELTLPTYDESIVSLLKSIVSTHDLIICGYSGHDEALARIIGDATETSGQRIYWCDPQPPDAKSPLFQRIGARCEVVQAAFDTVVDEIARPVLERPRRSSSELSLIPRLLDWRVDYTNREYFREYGERRGTSIRKLIAPRPAIESRMAAFLEPSAKPLAIVTGASGYGKSTLGIRLHDSVGRSMGRRVLLIKSKSLRSADIDTYISEQLEGVAAGSTGISLATLERWLSARNLQLVVFIDAINEFNTDFGQNVLFFRSIVRTVYFLPEAGSAIRLIVTIRQESWNAMLSRIDGIQLRQVAWSDVGTDDTIATIAVPTMTDDELNDALEKAAEHAGSDIRFDNLSAAAVERLRDPFILSFVTESGVHPSLAGPALEIYDRVFSLRLDRNSAGLSAAPLKQCLSTVALRSFQNSQDWFREADLIAPISVVTRELKDLGFIIEGENGKLRFAHDRLEEYFLALSFSLGNAPALDGLHSLLRFLHGTATNSKARAAARMAFAMDLSRFPVIEKAMKLPAAMSGEFTSADAEILFSFAREVIFDLTSDQPAFATAYLRDAISAAFASEAPPSYVRTLVQSVANLPDETSIPILVEAERLADNLAATEANIFATGKLLRGWLEGGCHPVDLLRESPYATYYGDESIPSWHQIGRLLSLLQETGPDNTHPDEYAVISAAVRSAMTRIVASHPLMEDDAVDVARYVLANTDRLIYNATVDHVRSFFAADRRVFLDILDDLDQGRVISREAFARIEPFTRTLATDLEYHAAHALMILSAMNDYEATMALWRALYDPFHDDSPPVEVNFFQSVPVYLLILLDRPYGSEHREYEERILRDWPAVFMYRPGLMRGPRRGYQDEFDLVFEDGFGVVFPYGILTPSAHRRSLMFRDYMRSAERTLVPLPLYTKYLGDFLARGETEQAVQLIQVLSSIIVAWPAEGLATLREAIGHADQRVHRAAIRALAEAYHRRQEETIRFLRESGSALTADDLQEIKIRRDPRIGRRQIEEYQWARVVYWMLRGRPDAADARRSFAVTLRSLLEAASYEEAVRKLLTIFGLSEPAGR